ncbi:hypothetical protein HYPSUDRAFT_200298 [Hypholoma sublateritium FD-334 SS-4]|uniref:Uncharacterized protein n=1 Tax=Hypholoma sublateritium (strain FD-334 SS-4) TaxID=945553 RepID=A0A0D2MLM7_HYPSF|nr:hypothetical protein HYPSUDRAFT_200298 [Hypholoma sublateritium FD-334 SS-4]
MITCDARMQGRRNVLDQLCGVPMFQQRRDKQAVPIKERRATGSLLNTNVPHVQRAGVADHDSIREVRKGALGAVVETGGLPLGGRIVWDVSKARMGGGAIAYDYFEQLLFTSFGDAVTAAVQGVAVTRLCCGLLPPLRSLSHSLVRSHSLCRYAFPLGHPAGSQIKDTRPLATVIGA